MAYVDGTRTGLSSSACSSTSSSGIYECSAPLPPLTPGVHSLELATWVSGQGGALESQKSAPLRVQMVGLSTAASAGSGSAPSEEFSTTDGVPLQADVLASGLGTLSDLAVTRDGRVHVLEQAGRVRVIAGEGLRGEPSLVLEWPGVRLCSIALHPEFERNGFVFLAYSAHWPGEQPFMRIARYREVRDLLGEAAIILDAVPLPPSFDCAGIRIRFGPEGKLYATVPDQEAASSAQSLGTLGGKVLRLNSDGTTPPDNPFASPVISVGHSLPEGFDWHPETRALWLAEQAGDVELLTAIVAEHDQEGHRGVAQIFRPAHVFDPPVGVGAITFHSGVGIPEFRGNLFAATRRGQHIQRLRFEPARPDAIVSSERVLEARFGRIGAIVAAWDGSVYVCTSNTADSTGVTPENYVVRISRRTRASGAPR